MDTKISRRPRKTSSARRRSTRKQKEHDHTQVGRLTIYTTPKKEFAMRYLALKEGKSVSRLLDECLSSVLQKSGINPDTLPGSLP